MLQTFSKILIFFAFLLLPLSAKAATLFLSPSSGTYKPGDSFAVSIYTSSADQAMNAASGVLSFPKDTLEVVSLSKGGSIFSLWAQEPSFSNSAGTVNFEGIVLNPGFTGGSGKILTVNLKVKSSGTASVRLSSGSILANDGLGTNILSGLGSASFSLALPAEIVGESPKPTPPKDPKIEEKEVKKDPPAPTTSADIIVTSATHPDQALWYNNNTPEFFWTLPPGTLQVRTVITTSTNSLPTILYTSPISTKKVDTLPDGTYYFLVQAKTIAGWGNVARYQVNIDTTPPNPFTITFPHGEKSIEPQPVILFNTSDESSGVVTYEVKVGTGGLVRVAPPALSNPYPLPPQKPGNHTVTVVAIDNAGNTTEVSSPFSIESIDPPEITFYPETVDFHDLIRIRGRSYPNSDIRLIVRQEDFVVSEEIGRTNTLGDFGVLVTKRLDPGIYTFTVEVTDARGAKSIESSAISFEVKGMFIGEIMNILVHFPLKSLLFILSICAVFVIIFSVCSRGANFWYQERKKSKKIFVKSLYSIRKDLDAHIKQLNVIRSKRTLTNEELNFLSTFQKKMKEVDFLLEKEIEEEKQST